ncbi:Ubiquitin-conjugating enzyme family protein [Euphorbia peplus]|nr:Ubiquitin-conjugating enzyme family protein [Euphorbia peplus]
MSSESQNGAVFPKFDAVSDFSDHSYAKTSSTISPNLQKKIAKEWEILEHDLPDSILVRVYEDRIDLLRAVITGPAGTPYHDGLYFFDIAFPSDYPARPPLVHYRSLGFRINPNLYANGYVCLSLLNTWTGKTSERWNPEKSTLARVLVSIQGLVLNAKPYFNEPGFGGLRGKSKFEKRSDSYNADVFVMCCKTMLFHQRSPPKHFEALVAGHFRERGGDVLRACHAYVNGAVRVGDYESGSGLRSSVSMEFKRSIELLYPQLVGSFDKNGAALGDLRDMLVVDVKTTPPSKKSQKGSEGFFGKLMKLFGCLKKSEKKKSVDVKKVSN